MPHKIMALRSVKKYEALAKKLGVSEVARSRSGFLGHYKNAGTAANLHPDWKAKREAFIARHMAQVKKNGERMFDDNGNPTRRHLALIMWAYSPVL